MASTSKLTLKQLLERAKNTQQTAARQQTNSIDLLVKALEKLASESTAKEERIAELVAEVASLKVSNEDKDRKLAALQTSTNERINIISRELHPGGRWEWVWEGGNVEGEESDDEAKMGAGRTMSLAMKQELADELSVEKDEGILRRVIDLIQRTLPLPDGPDNTVELDIESLSDSVVFELYDLVVGVEEEEEESRSGGWSWSLNGYTFRKPATTVNASRSPPPSFDSSLPIELADMIISLLDNREKKMLCLTSYHFLGLASRSLYNSPTLTEEGAAAFLRGKTPTVSSDNRIRPLLVPNALNLRRKSAIFQNFFPSHLLPANGTGTPASCALPRVNVLAFTIETDLRLWTPFLRLLNPLVFSLTITAGPPNSHLVPPTITRVPLTLLGFASSWDRLEEVVASGAGSVLVIRGGKGDKIAFGDCLERSRENEKPQVVDYVLETRRLGKEEVEVERVSKWTSVATRLGKPAPTLVGDEVGCCFRMWA